MSVQELLDSGKAILEAYCESSTQPEENRIDIWVSPKNFKASIQALVEEKWGYLVTITGIDHPAVDLDEDGVDDIAGMIEGLYHFANLDAILTVRVKVPYDRPELDSICDLIPSATIYEREFIELFGIDLEGTPNRDHLVLPDGWPDGIYPLRKSFNGISQEDVG